MVPPMVWPEQLGEWGIIYRRKLGLGEIKGFILIMLYSRCSLNVPMKTWTWFLNFESGFQGTDQSCRDLSVWIVLKP